MTEKSLTDDFLEIKFSSDREKEFLAILLGDLSLSGWTGSFHDNHLELKRVNSAEPESKNEIRRVHQLYRNQQLLDPSVRKFIKGLNTYKYFNGKRVSIKNLICDGNILVDRLKNKTNNGDYNSLPIQPYIQEASSSKHCLHTGFILSDIWRYFRHTISDSISYCVIKYPANLPISRITIPLHKSYRFRRIMMPKHPKHLHDAKILSGITIIIMHLRF